MTLRLTPAEAKKMNLKISSSTPVGNKVLSTPFGAARRGGRMPDDVLWESVSLTYSQAVRELKGAIPGRRFRIDIALPDVKIALEVDGWQFHGKYRSAHESDRERQNLFAVHGWLVLRFTAGQIFKDMYGVMDTIAAACQQRSGA